MNKKHFVILMLLMASGTALLAQNMACFGLQNPSSFDGWYGRTGIRSTGVSTGSTIYNTASTSTTNISGDANLAAVTTTGSCGSGCNLGSNPDNNKNRFQIITQALNGSDYHSNNNFNRVPPGYVSSIRLGDMCSSDGNSAEALYYEMEVSAENALVFVEYACVMEAPTHGASGNPEFIIRVCKATYNDQGVQTGWATTPANENLYYIVQAPNGLTNLPTGWSGYQNTTSCKYVYKPWTTVAINLYELLYQKVRIELYISDCNAEYHGAYCYIAGKCQPMRLVANGCAAGSSPTVATIKAPANLAAYQWYSCTTSTGLSTDDSLIHYQAIQGATDSVLEITTNDFRNGSQILNQRTFLCRMTSYMDPSKPIYSNLTCNVGNMKPTLSVDSVLYCGGDVELTDQSFVMFFDADSNKVDTSKTTWSFYTQSAIAPTATPEEVLVGGTVRHNYATGGNHAVKVRVSAFDTSCWNEKTIVVRSLVNPRPSVLLSANDICIGDTITLTDGTVGATYHKWIFYDVFGNGINDTIVQPGAALRYRFDTTTRVRLWTHTSQLYRYDTNHDGTIDNVYCFAYIDTVVRVGKFPTLTVHGDTIVCNGNQSDVWVESDVPNCTFNWYEALYGTTPVSANNAHLITTISQDRKFYVKVTSPNGCDSWDSVYLYLVKPTLACSKDKMCTGDTVRLWAGKAATYEWSASPDDDASFWGQEGADTIVVSPEHTTTYTVIGHGTNGCGATPLNQKITVYPYPIEAVQLTPDYIDSENPSVQFSDISEYGTSSLWNFGNGNTSTIRSVVYTFTDLSQDSILISLITGNALGCTSDTSFYIPVGIFTVWFPNAFTPRLETNNIFKAYTANELNDYELYIYDRQGNMVFQTTNVEEGWDGTYKGKDCKEGAYVYITQYRRQGVDRLMSQKGTVLLIR